MRSLKINGQTQPFIPIAQWRSLYTLPESFGVGLFESKDYTGLAALDQAGTDLRTLRSRILEAVPNNPPRLQLPLLVDELQNIFDTELRRINPRIGLHEPEIEFAVAGFGDVCRTWAYALIRARGEKLDFNVIYREWVDDSIRVSTQEHMYPHGDDTWMIRILNSVYGRIGLEVTMPTEKTAYVADLMYACPAEGFMASLLQDVATKLQGT